MSVSDRRHSDTEPFPGYMAGVSSPVTVSSQDRDTSPKRLLIVTADMGEGHNATARAIEQAARRLWPDCGIRWVDALEAMGRGVGPTFRWIFVTNVQTTPPLYELFYGSLWRRRWFSSASKQVVAAWSGRGLAPAIEEYDPDLIVSTYPLGNAGLQWLRRHRGLNVPVAAWVADFAPHPFWLYPDLDLYYVMHDSGVPVAKAAEPGASVAVCAPPVTDAYAPGDRRAARRRLGLAEDAFVALLSCGSLGFGAVDEAVRILLSVDPGIQVVAVCGRNEQLRERLAAWDCPPRRLLVLGWTDEMPSYMVASDAFVTNNGGVTAMEALSCGRAVVMFDPIAAHGRASAALMADCGLALLCPSSDDLAREVRRLVEEPRARARLERSALAHVRARTREEDLRAVAALGVGGVPVKG
ncbi:MAG: glycosyltransferase [Streptosporangiales bacterium]|nr:glycosyltransferase [Streptosporangiales bacterium]